MILHINMNYIAGSLYSAMLAHMPQPEEHVVYAPAARKARTYTLMKQELGHPEVHVMPGLSSWERMFYRHRHHKMYQALQKSVSLDKITLSQAYTLFTDGALAQRLFREKGVPYIVSLQDRELRRLLNEWNKHEELALEILEDASAITFLSEGMRQEVVERLIPVQQRDHFRRKSHVIPHGIDDFWLDNPPPESLKTEQQEICPKTVRLLFVGTLNRNKNVMQIQEARRLLQERGISTRLDMVGRVVNRRLYDALLNVPNTVYHTPESKEELIHCYRKADIFVMPSFYEAFGLVYAEALSQGLPIIYSRGQGFDEQFPNGEVGYAVYPQDPTSIADAIEAILKDKAIRKRALAGASRFDWKQVDAQYEAIYRQLLPTAPTLPRR